MSSNNYIVKPVYKALRVLQCLGSERRKMTLTEICHLVRLPKTTVFRYLYTLHECGFVACDPEADLYWIGLRIFELAQLASEQVHIREFALPFSLELRDRFGETVNLGILDGKEVVYVEMIEGRHFLRMQARLGSRVPVYSTALGKAFLAFMREEQWSNHLPAHLVAYTAHTFTSYPALKQDLILTRKRGFSLDKEETEEGASCVGAPIFNHLGQVIAALSVSAPANRLVDKRRQEIGTAVMQVAGVISKRLGYQANEATV